MKVIIQKKIMLFIFFFTLMVGCINGCDIYVDAQFSILNNTSDTIKLHFSELSYFGLQDSIVICNPHTEDIFEKYKTDYIKNAPCHPFIEEKTDLSITVTTSSGKTLKKDIHKNHNWYCAENSSHLWKVVFEINEEDLE